MFWPNSFDWHLQWARFRKVRSILIAWNRGLGDIPLGLYLLRERVHEVLPEAEITFLVREDLCEGMTLLAGARVIGVPFWRRGEPYHVKETLHRLGISEKWFEWILAWPDPTRWCRRQLGVTQPRLVWSRAYDSLWQRFGLSNDFIYFGVQLNAETAHGPWRSWPLNHWRELVYRLEQKGNIRILLLGQSLSPNIESPIVYDLRRQMSLFELLAIAQHKCRSLLLPDSGILSILYYLDVCTPMRIVSFWADKQGVLKQSVPSPNPALIHIPLIGARYDLSTVSVDEVMSALSLS